MKALPIFRFLLTASILLCAMVAYGQRPPGGVPGGVPGRPPIRPEGFRVPARAEPEEVERIEIEDVEFSGVLEQMLPNRSGFVFSVGGQRHTADLAHEGIAIAPARIMYDREEDLRFVKPGMILRFNATMERGDVENNISRIEIVGHVENPPFPALGLTQIHELDDDDGDLVARRPGQETGQFQVVGRLKRTIRKNRMLIEMPDAARPERWRTLGAVLDENPKVELASMIFANRGDPVDVKGVQPVRELGNVFWATDVRIKGATKGDAPAKRGPRGRETARSDDGPAEIRKASTPGRIVEIN